MNKYLYQVFELRFKTQPLLLTFNFHCWLQIYKFLLSHYHSYLASIKSAEARKVKYLALDSEAWVLRVKFNSDEWFQERTRSTVLIRGKNVLILQSHIFLRDPKGVVKVDFNNNIKTESQYHSSIDNILHREESVCVLYWLHLFYQSKQRLQH